MLTENLDLLFVEDGEDIGFEGKVYVRERFTSGEIYSRYEEGRTTS